MGLWIYLGYPMRRKPITAETHLEVDGIQGFFMRKVTKFGNSAKVDCPKEFIGYTVYLVVTNKKSE